jgi:hypothetical protein
MVNVFTSINNLALNYTTRCSPHKLKLCSSQTAPAEPYLSLRTVDLLDQTTHLESQQYWILISKILTPFKRMPFR